jgi:hypothetical protein
MFLRIYGLFLRIPSINMDDFISNCMNVQKMTSYDMELKINDVLVIFYPSNYQYQTLYMSCHYRNVFKI